MKRENFDVAFVSTFAIVVMGIYFAIYSSLGINSTKDSVLFIVMIGISLVGYIREIKDILTKERKEPLSLLGILLMFPMANIFVGIGLIIIMLFIIIMFMSEKIDKYRMSLS